nr:DUF1819 family protein [uncultured Peptostreptococcus sp.]
MDSNAPYIASLTREPFMYYEMKITAKLLEEGLSEKEAIEKIFKENLYQYPTERSLKIRARACIKRLNALEDKELISWIINRPLDISRQVCLYAMMKQSRLIWEFMITVIGEKYRTRNFSYSRMDLNVFFTRLQEQNDIVASWSDSTIEKLKSVFGSLLKENGYIDKTSSKRLNEVLLDYKLKDKIIENGDATCLPAFNYFE